MILHTADVHGHVLAYDYVNDHPTAGRGFACLAPMIHTKRRSADAALLFDTGDFLQGSALADRFAETGGATEREHPVIRAMNTMGYDAVTLGNHELDYGLPYLAEALSTSRFPIVSANLQIDAPGFEKLARYCILEREAGTGLTLKIGVTGCVPIETLGHQTRDTPSVHCEQPLPALRRVIAQMKAEGADLIVVLAHCGKNKHLDTNGSDLGEQIMALQGVDAALFGHTHEVFPRAPYTTAGTSELPVTQPGAHGTHLGGVAVSLKRSEGTKPLVVQSSAQVWPLSADAPACPKITQDVQPDHERTRAENDALLGWTDTRIDSFFSLAENDAGLQFLAEVFVSDVRRKIGHTLEQSIPILSAVAPYRTGQRAGADDFRVIPKGAVRAREIDKFYAFPDKLCALKVSGKALRLWLETSASIFAKVARGAQSAKLLNPDYPGYLFDVVPQLTYQIDISAPPMFSPSRHMISPAPGRIRALRFDGAPVQDEAEFIVATTAHRADLVTRALTALTPSVSGLTPPELVYESERACRAILADAIKTAGVIAPLAEPSWSFAPLDGATALFETSPCAPQTDRFTSVCITDAGFQQMCMTL